MIYFTIQQNSAKILHKNIMFSFFEYFVEIYLLIEFVSATQQVDLIQLILREQGFFQFVFCQFSSRDDKTD